ncbi:conserved Plasmodium protein, unknown function, partial [Plasmodium ovale]
MGEYTRKIPFYNDYEKKKDLLKFTCLRENDKDDTNKNSKKKNQNNDVQFRIKKRENMRDILTHRPDLNSRTQRDVLSERKTKLKEDISDGFYAYEKKYPFLIDTIVVKPKETKCIRDALNNTYEPDNTSKFRISKDIKTKAMLLERRKEMFANELNDSEMMNFHQGLFLDPEKNYTDVVKNKNKLLTLKNYGFWHPQSSFVFSYPDIRARGLGGFATEMMKSRILENKNENIKKWVNTENVY